MSAQFMLITSLLFFGSFIAVPIASRLGLGSVLGYLLAGIALSPILQWAGTDVIGLQHFAEFGVVMMLFLVGLEMSPKALWQLRSQIFLLGGLQVLFTASLIMVGLILLDQPWQVGLTVGLVLALSSTAIVNQTLNEKGLLKSDGGQASFAVLLFQDIAVIPMLVFIPLLAVPELQDLLSSVGAEGEYTGHAETGTALTLNIIDSLNGWQAALASFSVILVVVLGGHFLTDPIFRFISRTGLRELFVSTALMLILIIALLMTVVGLSPALGTFLAGVVMARSEYRHEIESDISPFKGIFLGIFFITVGAGINFELLEDNISVVFALTFGLIALKIFVLVVLAWLFRLHDGDKWLFALSLAQAGEFGFVLLSFTVANSVISQAVAEMALLVVALSMLFTPLLFLFYDKVIAPRYSRQQQKRADQIDRTTDIIIAGHGRFGGIVNRAVSAAGFDTTVVDFSTERLELLRKFEVGAYFGDATRPDLLQSAGIEQAKVLVVALDDKDSITQVTRYVCQYYPEVHVVARAVDLMHVYDLWSVGCRDIIREIYDSALRTGRSVFEALGYSREQATEAMSTFETADRKMMVELANLYQIDVPISENRAFMDRYKEMMSGWKVELKDKMLSNAVSTKDRTKG